MTFYKSLMAVSAVALLGSVAPFFARTQAAAVR